MRHRRNPIDALTRIDPIDGDRLAAAWSNSDAKQALMQEITAMPIDTLPSATEPTSTQGLTGKAAVQRRIWTRPRRMAALGAAAVVAVALLVVVQPLGRQATSAWATEVLQVAEAAPRLLVTEPGWDVIRADEFSVDVGEMTFGDGRYELDLHWRPGSRHDDYMQDRAASADPPADISVAGHPAVLYRYTGTTDFAALWLDGDHSVELRGSFPTVDDYLAVVGTVREVGVDEWLTAMPASTVRPESRAAVVEAMLTDIPIPSSLSVEALEEGDSISDRYQLGAQVTGAVACAWIDQWLAATETGDVAAAREAVDALNTSRNWAILLEMQSDGFYPEMVWLHADALANGGVAQDGFSVSGYTDALGCSER